MNLNLFSFEWIWNSMSINMKRSDEMSTIRQYSQWNVCRRLFRPISRRQRASLWWATRHSCGPAASTGLTGLMVCRLDHQLRGQDGGPNDRQLSVQVVLSLEEMNLQQQHHLQHMANSSAAFGQRLRRPISPSTALLQLHLPYSQMNTLQGLLCRRLSFS